jgi:alpha-beta hydrolase superfamily lysophospholipase
MPLLPPQIKFCSAADGRRLAARVWCGSQLPRGRVVFLHGITSHGGWYDRSCAHLAAAGYEVHFLDRRGSGLNAAQADDIDRCETWIEDVAVYLRGIGSDDPGKRNDTPLSFPCSPHFAPILCGISWGGKLAVAVARRHPALICGLGLICPGLYSHQEPGLLKRLLLAVPLPARLASRRVRIPLEDPALFIGHSRGQQFVGNDPLALREISLRFARADRELSRFARRAAPYLHVPLLLMLAGRDRIVDNRRTRAFFARAAGPHKTLIEYPDATHTLEFEADPSRYCADLLQWVENTQRPGAARQC